MTTLYYEYNVMIYVNEDGFAYVGMVRLHISANPVQEYVLLIYLLNHEKISYVQYVYPRFRRPIIYNILVNKP